MAHARKDYGFTAMRVEGGMLPPEYLQTINALQAKQQDHARRRRVLPKPSFGVAEERQHLVSDDLDDLLTGRQTLQDGLVHRLVADAIDERLDDLEVDVSFKQRQPDFSQRGLDMFGREPDLAAQRLENILNARAERLEHGVTAAGPTP